MRVSPGSLAWDRFDSPGEPDPLDASWQVSEERLQPSLVHILAGNTGDQNGTGLRQFRMVGRNEVSLTGDEPMLHLVPDQVDDPDWIVSWGIPSSVGDSQMKM